MMEDNAEVAQQIKWDKEDKLCCICRVRKITHLLKPCCHKFCQTCISLWREERYNKRLVNNCPVCRTDIENSIRIEIAEAATVIQKYTRGYLARTNLEKKTVAATVFQKYTRGYLARSLAWRNYIKQSLSTNINSTKLITDFDMCSRHALIIQNGNLFGCGDNSYGQLGFKHPPQSRVHYWIPYSSSVAQFMNIEFPHTSPPIQVSVKDGCSFVICKDGSLWAAGNNAENALAPGMPDALPSFTRIKSIPSEYHVHNVSIGVRGHAHSQTIALVSTGQDIGILELNTPSNGCCKFYSLQDSKDTCLIPPKFLEKLKEKLPPECDGIVQISEVDVEQSVDEQTIQVLDSNGKIWDNNGRFSWIPSEFTEVEIPPSVQQTISEDSRPIAIANNKHQSLFLYSGGELLTRVYGLFFNHHYVKVESFPKGKFPIKIAVVNSSAVVLLNDGSLWEFKDSSDPQLYEIYGRKDKGFPRETHEHEVRVKRETHAHKETKLVKYHFKKIVLHGQESITIRFNTTYIDVALPVGIQVVNQGVYVCMRNSSYLETLAEIKPAVDWRKKDMMSPELAQKQFEQALSVAISNARSLQEDPLRIQPSELIVRTWLSRNYDYLKPFQLVYNEKNRTYTYRNKINDRAKYFSVQLQRNTVKRR